MLIDEAARYNFAITNGDDFNIYVTFPFDITGFAWEGKFYNAKQDVQGTFDITPDLTPPIGEQKITIELSSVETAKTENLGTWDYTFRFQDTASKWHTFARGHFFIGVKN